eukprot:436423-Prorocentrum_minimum.AAC.2
MRRASGGGLKGVLEGVKRAPRFHTVPHYPLTVNRGCFWGQSRTLRVLASRVLAILGVWGSHKLLFAGVILRTVDSSSFSAATILGCHSNRSPLSTFHSTLRTCDQGRQNSVANCDSVGT